MAHPEIGHKILMRLIGDLADVAMPETNPRMEGNQMHTILTAKKGGGGGAKPPKPASQPASAASPPRPAEVETK
jgi:hypothetical protein